MITQDFLNKLDIYADPENSSPIELSREDIELLKEATFLFIEWHHPIATDISERKEAMEYLRARLLKEGLRRARLDMRRFVQENTQLKPR